MAANTDRWFWWDWVGRNTDLIWSSLREHVILTVVSVLVGLAVALPLGVLCARHRRLYGAALAVTGALYSVPSLAAVAFLLPYWGTTRPTAIVPLVSYTLLILLRNVVAGLDDVSDEILDAADGMGYSRWKRLVRIELPLASPSIVAGVRIATVTTVGLVAVAGLLGIPNLGNLIRIGQNRPIRTAITVGIGLSVALALAADLILQLAGRVMSPWRRRVDA